MRNIKKFQITAYQNAIYIKPTGFSKDFNTVLKFDRDNMSITEIPVPDKSSGLPRGEKSVSYVIGVYRTGGKHFIVVVEDCTRVAKVQDQTIYRIDAISYINIEKENSNTNRQIIENLTNQRKLLLEGFYFSLDGDITKARQYTQSEDSFCWNYFLFQMFRDNHISQKWHFPIIQGYVEQIDSEIKQKSISIVIISRRSRIMGGTRYNSRGLNDDGHVANFIETEQILIKEGLLFSFVQIRGSVPIFWAQDSNLAGCKLTRSKDLTATAFTRHFQLLRRKYGDIFAVNLMQKNKPSEQILNENFEQQLSMAQLNYVHYQHVDFHSICKGGKSNGLNSFIYDYKKVLEKTKMYVEQEKIKIENQDGTFRLNCLDCLDRTNLYMSKIALLSLNLQLEISGLKFCPHESILDQFDESNKKLISDIVIKFKNMWANNGDMLSKLYSGCGSTVSEMTREGKRSFMGMIEEKMRNIQRFYSSTFEDESKQIAIDQLLQGFSVNLSNEEQWLTSQQQRFSTVNNISIFLVTWNVGGKEPTRKDFLDTLLNFEEQKPPDLIVFGLQEMVDLNPQNIMIMSNDKTIQLWDSIFAQNLDKVDRYVKLQQANLVGIFLVVYVKLALVPRIGSIDSDTVKTGLGGTLGNKGGALIRFKIDDTTIGLINCHLTSGGKQWQERHSDIDEIHQKGFSGSKQSANILNSDYIFLIGDMNFRIDCSYQEVVTIINNYKCILEADQESNKAKRMLTELLNMDQLTRTKSQNQFLQNYQEGGITFLPTYKYDPHSDVYDTSKKQRTPSWCDRILIYCKNDLTFQQLFYNRRECQDSDHRPVVSYLTVEIKKFDKQKLEEMKQEYKMKQVSEIQEMQKAPQQDFFSQYYVPPQVQPSYLKQEPQIVSGFYQPKHKTQPNSSTITVDNQQASLVNRQFQPKISDESPFQQHQGSVAFPHQQAPNLQNQIDYQQYFQQPKAYKNNPFVDDKSNNPFEDDPNVKNHMWKNSEPVKQKDVQQPDLL